MTLIKIRSKADNKRPIRGTGPHNGQGEIDRLNPHSSIPPLRLFLATCLIMISLFTQPPEAAAYNITPSTWNIIGLDSNTPTSPLTPNQFPVGAKICGGTAGETDTVVLHWDAGGTDNGTNIYTAPKSQESIQVTFGSDGCADAFYLVEVNRNAPFGSTRRYHITSAKAGSTPMPRELYVERLVSQYRNSISSLSVDGKSIPAGGALNLVVGNTYTIVLSGSTAPGGYEQFTDFINFPNTYFQLQSVNTTYTAYANPVTSPYPYLYADGCGWDNDPASLNYRSCTAANPVKVGGNITTTYKVKILAGGGTSSTLATMLYDFSGASTHYNGDFSTNMWIANVIDPNSLTFSKSFSPNPTNTTAGSTLSFTISNPNAGVISDLSFTDIFPKTSDIPAAPGNMTLASTAVTNSCGGTLTDSGGISSLAVGSTGIKLTGGSVQANGSCVISVKVAVTATGTYNNSTLGNLKVGSFNTTIPPATASLTVDNTITPPTPPPSSCSNPVELARWNFNNSTAGSLYPAGGLAASSHANDVTTSLATYGAGTGTISGIANPTPTLPSGWDSRNPPATTGNDGNSWGIQGGWLTAGTITGSTTPYFQFELDTTNYGGVGIISNYNLQGNWSNPGNWKVLSSTDGSSWSALGSMTSANENRWQSPSRNAPISAGPVLNGTSKTYFRIEAVGSGNGGAAPAMFVDNVIITGCPRVKPPVISKDFAPNSTLSGGTSTLTFLITNPNQNTDLTKVNFTDTFPADMKVKTPAVYSISGCTATTYTPVAGAGSITFAGGTIPKGATCKVTVDITATATGTNTVLVKDTDAGNGNTDSADLTVKPPHPAMSLFKEVATATSAPDFDSSLWQTDLVVTAGDKIYYQFTAQNDGDVPLTEVHVTDVDPAIQAKLDNCVWMNLYYNGTAFTAVPLTLNPDKSFTLEVANPSNYKDFAFCIVESNAAIVGTHPNTARVDAKYSGTPLPQIAGITDETAIYFGFIPPTVTKSFSPASIPVDGTSIMTITVTNPATNPGNLTGVSINDNPYPAPLKNNASGSVTCSGAGSATLTDGVNDGTSVGFNAGTIIPGGTCIITQSVTTTATVANSTDTPKSTGAVIPGNGAASIALTGTAAGPVTLTVYGPPTLTKSFSTAIIESGQTVTLTFTITNPVNSPAITGGISFTDSMPANLVIAETPNIDNKCGGTPTVTATAGTNIFAIAGTGLAAPVGPASCTISVDITSYVGKTAPGYINGAAQITAISTPLINGVTDQMLEVKQPLLVISKTADPPVSVNPGAFVTYTVTATNSGNATATTVTMTDKLSPFANLCLDSFAGAPFEFTTASTTLTYNPATPTYSSHTGAYTPTVLTGCDPIIASWHIPLSGNLGVGESYTLKYKVKVK